MEKPGQFSKEGFTLALKEAQEIQLNKAYDYIKQAVKNTKA